MVDFDRNLIANRAARVKARSTCSRPFIVDFSFLSMENTMTEPQTRRPPVTTDSVLDHRQPPRRLGGIIGQLGPGLIIAAAIVGSGELIATTLTGAQAGIVLLWLIILGCVIKVFVQIEIGRATIISGKQTLSALDTIPGPRVKGRGNWLVWYWFAMWFCSISQLGGIVGGCGQALAMVYPLTAQGELFVETNRQRIEAQLAAVIPEVAAEEALDVEPSADQQQELETAAAAEAASVPTGSIDDRLWCIPIAIFTSILLLRGRYGVIQSVSTVLVAIFTAVTLWNVVRIQQLPNWQVTGAQFLEGLSFRLPGADNATKAIAVALSTIGIIGVGAAELIQYPYWCLEKGYARWTGRNDGSPEWTARAKGWLKVMQFDAWCSMVIYTFATIAFFILGVAILHRAGLVPEKSMMLQTLMTMYTPVFGAMGTPIFIVGAIVVLYSTFFVANASHARTFTDGMCVVGALDDTPQDRARWVRILSALFPMLCLVIYWCLPEPALLVMISGAAQTLMLPMLGFAALVFRYRDTPKDLRPSVLWDVFLWTSVLVMGIMATWSIYAFAQNLLSS